MLLLVPVSNKLCNISVGMQIKLDLNGSQVWYLLCIRVVFEALKFETAMVGGMLWKGVVFQS